MSGSPTKRGPLLFMKSIEDALALCDKEQDPFYLDAFMIEAWLDDIALQAVVQVFRPCAQPVHLFMAAGSVFG